MFNSLVFLLDFLGMKFLIDYMKSDLKAIAILLEWCMFENRGIAGFFADSRRIQGKKHRNPFGFRGFLTLDSPLFVEKDGISDFSNSP